MNHTIQLPDDFQLVRECSEKEYQDHLSYLIKSTQKKTGGWCPPTDHHWYIARISSLATLGNFRVFWETLGNTRLPNRPNVSKLLPLLQRGYDDSMLQIISEYREGLSSGEYTLERRVEGSCPVTVVYCPDLIIHDGNKHAVAYYENMKAENRQDINLELFFLTPIAL